MGSHTDPQTDSQTDRHTDKPVGDLVRVPPLSNLERRHFEINP